MAGALVLVAIPASADHTAGDVESHPASYADGEKVTRLYGPAYYLGELAPGTHAVSVTLNGNDHGDDVQGDEVVESEVEVDVPATGSRIARGREHNDGGERAA